MHPDTDRLARWLLGSLQLDTAVLHGPVLRPLARLHGGPGTGQLSPVLDGHCYLHLDGAAPIALGPRDGVFLLRDLPHFLSPHSDPLQAVSAQAMLPLQAPTQQPGDGAGLRLLSISRRPLRADRRLVSAVSADTRRRARLRRGHRTVRPDPGGGGRRPGTAVAPDRAPRSNCCSFT
jgi:hypothetical protein